MDGVWTRQCEPSSEAARQSRERQQSGGRLRRETGLGPFAELGSHDSSADRWTWGSLQPGQEGVHINGNVGAPVVRDGLEAPRDSQDAEPGAAAWPGLDCQVNQVGVLGSTVALTPGLWPCMVLILIPGFSLTPALD